MGYDRGDSFPVDFEPNEIPFGSKSKGKLSPRSYPIQCERNWKYSFLSGCGNSTWLMPWAISAGNRCRAMFWHWTPRGMHLMAGAILEGASTKQISVWFIIKRRTVAMIKLFWFQAGYIDNWGTRLRPPYRTNAFFFFMKKFGPKLELESNRLFS